MVISGVDNLKLGPQRPSLPISIVHPLGPLFRYLPLTVRRHILYTQKARRIGNFTNPISYTEKVQWRIINDRRPLLSWTSDKLAQCAYLAKLKQSNEVLAGIRLPEIYWVGKDIEELRKIGPKLPKRFVIKPNHSSGRYISVDTSGAPLDWSAVAHIANTWIDRDEEELVFGHWPHRKARHLLIAEERIGSEAVPASEMRGWVFDGVLQQITRFDVRPRIASNYDRTFARIETSRVLDAPIDKANHFDSVATAEKERLVRLMEVIGAPFDHMRVDIFIDGGQFWFNELSPFPFGGLVYYSNRDFDLLRGSFWKLPDLSASDPNTSDWEALLSETPLGIFQ